VIPVIIWATGTISRYLENTVKARSQETTENSHTGHCTHTSGSSTKDITLERALYAP
jgi:hypothetical protein